jgi:hypothetical protein
MNKQELIDALNSKFHTVDEAGLHTGDTIAGITVWHIRVFEEINGVMKRPTLTFYTDSKDNAFWGNTEPSPTIPIPDPTFTDRVNVFIASKITDGTIRFAYIGQISNDTKKALVTAIMFDKTEKKAIISEAVDGTFSLEQL